MEKIKPFVKWAGGKGNLLQQLNNYYPMELKYGYIDTYIEPFIGGGAVLIDILQKYSIKKAYAIDINKDLINCYNVIKNDAKDLINELKIKQKEFIPLQMEDRANYFYDVRDEYNSYEIDKNELSLKRAAEFIFLNRTCFNGLYRVNRKGKFNVPFGNYKNPIICDEINLINLSLLIQNVEFKYGDYKTSIQYATDNTFVYFDPPYRPLPKTNSFTSYMKDNFNDSSQKELSEYFSLLSNMGAKVMLSNSNPKNTEKEDCFFDNLYKGFNIYEVYAKRLINCNSKGRGAISELLITNYDNTKMSY